MDAIERIMKTLNHEEPSYPHLEIKKHNKITIQKNMC